MRRVSVIGVTGSGKTTFAIALAERLKRSRVELDSLHWGPRWTPRDDFLDRVAQAVAADEWIIDGNYSKARDLIWPRADTIIWLDYSRATILQRLVRRTARRCWSRQELWAGNRERVVVQLFSRESIFVWAWKSFQRYRQEYPPLLMSAARRGTYIVRFRSPRQAREWLDSLHALHAE